MKFSLAILVLAFAVANASNFLTLEWEQFKREHTKQYSSSLEELQRFQIWKSNLDLVNKHNADADNGKHTYWLGMNKFADLTAKEFGRLYNGFNASLKVNARNARTHVHNPRVQLPDSVDWRTQGYVTPIKDQGQCGSCWGNYQKNFCLLI